MLVQLRINISLKFHFIFVSEIEYKRLLSDFLAFIRVKIQYLFHLLRLWNGHAIS
jgi:hypothetical protein